MSNLGEQAMEILDELHTERLSYESEYVPLADAANLLTAYEQTGMDPEAIDQMADAYGRGLTLREDAAERLQMIRGLSTARLRELAEADREGRCCIPPVKMHQKIFRVFDGEIREEIVCGAIWEPFMPRPRWKVFVMGAGLPYFWHEVLGKTVFLTRAEAEAALRREQDV